MKRFNTAILLVLGLTSLVMAQSGRRVETLPSPSPTPVPEPTYSESVPTEKRSFRVFPARREEPKPAEKKPTSQSKTSAATTTDPLEEGPVERVETSLVTIPVSVFDRQGMYIPNLEQKNFKIFEDGEEQEIAYFGTSEKPFTVVILLDISPSTQYEIEEIRAAATAFVDHLKPQDKVIVIEFGRKVNLLSEATSDRATTYKAINKANFGSGTSLYDAVAFSLTKQLNAIDGRKAIVLFTDGVDTTSHKSYYDSTLALAEESESLIFPINYDTYEKTHNDALLDIGPPPAGTTAEEYAIGRKYLEELASYTGGRVFRPESTPGGLARAFEGIAEELRRQYNIGYVPKKDGTPGQRKQIKVRVDRPNLVVRARDTYIVGKTKK